MFAIVLKHKYVYKRAWVHHNLGQKESIVRVWLHVLTHFFFLLYQHFPTATNTSVLNILGRSNDSKAGQLRLHIIVGLTIFNYRYIILYR